MQPAYPPRRPVPLLHAALHPLVSSCSLFPHSASLRLSHTPQLLSSTGPPRHATPSSSHWRRIFHVSLVPSSPHSGSPYPPLSISPIHSYMLHWTITSRNALKLAVEERSSTGAGGGGWLMLAWARKGQPFPSDAIFGNLFGRRTVAAFTISGPGAAGAQPASFTLGRTAFGMTFNGAVMKFSRQRADGAVPVSYYGRNRLLWAFTTDSSANPALPPFYRGISVVDFSCTTNNDASNGGVDGDAGNGGGDGDTSYDPSPPPPTRTPSPPPSSNCLGSRKSSCSASSLPGYTSVVTLGKGSTLSPPLLLSSSPLLPSSPPPVPLRLMLHWKLLTTTSAAFCLQAKSGTAAAAGGWVSVAWSRGGAMVPADAVVGAPGGAARTYAITSYSSVDPTSRFSITGGSVNSGFNGVLLKIGELGLQRCASLGGIGVPGGDWGGEGETYAIASYSSVDPTSRFAITGGFNGVLLNSPYLSLPLPTSSYLSLPLPASPASTCQSPSLPS
ncbi:unnamed protein product [Closterium sp. NIES-54]